MNTTQLVLSAKLAHLFKGELKELVEIATAADTDLEYLRRIACASAQMMLNCLDGLQRTQTTPDPLNPSDSYLQTSAQKLFNANLTTLLDQAHLHPMTATRYAMSTTIDDLNDIIEDKPQSVVRREARTVRRSPSPEAAHKIQSILNS